MSTALLLTSFLLPPFFSPMLFQQYGQKHFRYDVIHESEKVGARQRLPGRPMARLFFPAVPRPFGPHGGRWRAGV